eukprot:TRINITY_DN166_c0_g1_i7.p1 TRINITY_DN166_c0_g1~~TRINITY_DN166_c0_g1_i7.p1  ORF type:complete len:292 (-),score=45.28 TRINITY_DN166_c0_g1_i7:58-933(-)
MFCFPDHFTPRFIVPFSRRSYFQIHPIILFLLMVLEYNLKAVGAGLWCVAYIAMIIMGLTNPSGVFCPYPLSTMAYTVSWEIVFSMAKPLVGRGERRSQTEREKNKTRLLFFWWILLDLVLVSMFLWGGNGLINEDLLTSRMAFGVRFFFWMVIHVGALYTGNAELFWLAKYFSIPLDIYISWTFYECISARAETFPKFDILVVLCKLLADFFYLLPMVNLWGGKLISHRSWTTISEDSESDSFVAMLKGCFVIGFSFLTWVSNVALLWWTFDRSTSVPSWNALHADARMM